MLESLIVHTVVPAGVCKLALPFLVVKSIFAITLRSPALCISV
jgi:hypothetical protein